MTLHLPTNNPQAFAPMQRMMDPLNLRFQGLRMELWVQAYLKNDSKLEADQALRLFESTFGQQGGQHEQEA